MSWHINRHYSKIQSRVVRTKKPHFIMFNGEWLYSYLTPSNEFRLLYHSGCRSMQELIEVWK